MLNDKTFTGRLIISSIVTLLVFITCYLFFKIEAGKACFISIVGGGIATVIMLSNVKKRKNVL